jgi:hypothetical protein
MAEQKKFIIEELPWGGSGPRWIVTDGKKAVISGPFDVKKDAEKEVAKLYAKDAAAQPGSTFIPDRPQGVPLDSGPKLADSEVLLRRGGTRPGSFIAPGITSGPTTPVDDQGDTHVIPRVVVSQAIAQQPVPQAAGKPLVAQATARPQAVGRFIRRSPTRDERAFLRRRKRSALSNMARGRKARKAGRTNQGIAGGFASKWATGRAQGGAAAGVKAFVTSRAAGVGARTAIGAGIGRMFAGAAGRGIGATIGGAIGAAGGPPGIAVGVGLGIAADMALKAAGALGGLSDKAEEATKALGGSSPSQAMIGVESSIRDWVREFRRGEATAATSREAMKARQAKEDAMAPINIALSNLGNQVSAWLDNLDARLARGTNRFLDDLKLLLNLPGIGGVGPTTAYEWLRDNGAEGRDKRADRKPGFAPIEFPRS